MKEPSNIENTKKLWSDYFSHTSITISAKDLSDARRKYRIPDTEDILEIYYNKHGLSKICVLVISNYAIYFDEIRWSLDNLCKYILIKNEQSYSISAINDITYILCPISVFSNNNNIDLYNRILSMQNYLYNISAQAKSDRKKLYKYIATDAKNKLTEYRALNNQTVQSLSTFINEEDFTIYSAELLLKNAILRGKISSINYYLNSLEKYYDTAHITTWLNKYLTDLFNHCANNNFNLPLCNRKNVESYTGSKDYTNSVKGIIFFYSRIHITHDILHEYFCNIPELIATLSLSEFTESDYKNFLLLWDKNITPSMLNICNIIKTNAVIESKKTFKKADGYGLTPYHYAILYNNKALLSKISSEDVFYRAINTEDDVLKILYDPLFIACFRHNDELFDLLITTKPEYKALVKTFNTIQKKIKTAISANSFIESFNTTLTQNTRTSTHEQQYATHIKKLYLNLISGNISDYRQLIKNYDSLDQLNEQHQLLTSSGLFNNFSPIESSLFSYVINLYYTLHEVAVEISALHASYKTKYNDYISAIKDCSDLFIKMLLQIYANPDVIQKHLNHDAEKIIINFGSNTFVINKINFKSYNHTDNKTESNANKTSNTQEWFKPKIKLSSLKKPYNKYWFSPAAHNDIMLLKKEYRKLALKYHPDTQIYETEVFIDIQAEREHIIEKLNH